MTNKTFTIIKPDLFKKGLTGQILDDIIKGGFRINAMKLYHMSLEDAKQFYFIHIDKTFFQELINYITSGPIVVAVLEKENAVEDYRKLIGNTNPAQAEKGTIREKYGESITNNAVHGADSDENAQLEASYFFSLFERY